MGRADRPLDAILVVRTLATMRGRIRQREWLIKSRWRETSRAAGLPLCHTNLRPNSCSVPLGSRPLQCWMTRVSQRALSTCPSCLWGKFVPPVQCDKLHISDSFHSYISLPRVLTQFLTSEFEPALPANKCSGIEMQMLSVTCAAKPTSRWGVGLPL